MGVGPGDPNLLTVAAVQAIAKAAVVAYPVAQPGAEGMAARIAAPWITEQRHLPLLFPMVAAAAPRLAAWRTAADLLAAELARAEQLVLLCEGMPPYLPVAPMCSWSLQAAIPNGLFLLFQELRQWLLQRQPHPVWGCPGPWLCKMRAF